MLLAGVVVGTSLAFPSWWFVPAWVLLYTQTAVSLTCHICPLRELQDRLAFGGIPLRRIRWLCFKMAFAVVLGAAFAVPLYMLLTMKRP